MRAESLGISVDAEEPDSPGENPTRELLGRASMDASAAMVAESARRRVELEASAPAQTWGPHALLDDLDPVAVELREEFTLKHGSDFRPDAAPPDAARVALGALDARDVVGRGAFCVVKACRLAGADCVVKVPRSDLDPPAAAEAISDLKREAALLAAMRGHAHVVRLLALPERPEQDGPFVALARVDVPFKARFAEWRRESDALVCCPLGRVTRCARLIPRCFRSCKRRVIALRAARVAAGRDLAAALRHLHEDAMSPDVVCYRDLKRAAASFSVAPPSLERCCIFRPANLGFDAAGRLVLFDFGLAKVLPRSPRPSSTEPFAMTGGTGSRRYMAPEVALHRAYDERCDVYSLGLLLWEIFALERPFDGFDVSDMNSLVVKKGQRPTIDGDWPEATADLVRHCWSEDPKTRPSADDAVRTLDHELALASL